MTLLCARETWPNIHFGTSSWIYPGWKGQIYSQSYHSEKAFRDNCLKEYGRCPLFSTIGIDHTFYRPPTTEQLLHYHALLPSTFSWAAKVWERITLREFPAHARYGQYAGKANPLFLDLDAFVETFLSKFQDSRLKNREQVFLFQFSPFPRHILDACDIVAEICAFLEELPRGFRYAVELRNKELVSRRYFELLRRSPHVTHCFNHWNTMPSLRKQMEAAAEGGGLDPNFFVARLLTPLGSSYNSAVRRFHPYDRIREENLQMRRDAVALIRRALTRQGQAFILVNNRAEGYAPGTIDAICRMIPPHTDRPKIE